MNYFLFLMSIVLFVGTKGWAYPILDSKNGSLLDDCFNVDYNIIYDKNLLEAILTGKTNVETKISDFCKHLNNLVTHLDDDWIDFVKAFDHYLSSHLNTINGMIKLSGAVQELIENYFSQTIKTINAISMPVAQLIYRMAYLDSDCLRKIKILIVKNIINI